MGSNRDCTLLCSQEEHSSLCAELVSFAGFFLFFRGVVLGSLVIIAFAEMFLRCLHALLLFRLFIIIYGICKHSL